MNHSSAQGTPHKPFPPQESSQDGRVAPFAPAPPAGTRPEAADASPSDLLSPDRCTGSEPKIYVLPDGLKLSQILREDFVHHDGDWTLPGFRALAVHRFGVWHRTIRSRVVRKVVGRVWLSLYRYVRNAYGIELPYTAVIGRRLRIEHQHGITLHGFSRIGDDCTIRQGVTIGNKSMHAPLIAPVLGDRVDVGAGAVIVGDVVVGDGARIGANAVVIHDVPPGATAVGVPAKLLEAKP